MHRYVRVAVSAAVAGLAAAALELAAPEASPRARGDLAYQEGRYREAASELEAYLLGRPDDGDARVRLGWCRFRLGEFDSAERTFAEQLRRDPASLDSRVGLGYARLHTSGPGAAAEELLRVLDAQPSNPDALRGMVLAGERSDADPRVVAAAIAAARRLVALESSSREASERLFALEARHGGPGEARRRPDASAEQPMRVPARALDDDLEVRGPDGSWQRVFVKGINLGAALPGRFPAEFPTDEATYASWLDTIAGLGANSVRVYTLLPPAFYRALVAHNAATGARRLWLIQGVWTELPPRHDFSDPEFVAGFEAEIARVIDAVHGDLRLAPRPGHASGEYDADGSGSLLALIIGREWEPFAVQAYDAAHPGETSWRGTWLEVEGGRAMECWVARMCDFAAGYEARRYRTLRPLTFANWPTLDPLVHPSEANRAEENAFRNRAGVAVTGPLAEAPWEDDAVSLDATRIRPRPAMAAGFFAAYHVYPNYPDFLNLEPEYARGRDSLGPSRYAAYLRALKAYHGHQPVLVAEFGISTSREVAHVQPEGWSHGGHDEREQGRLVARMLRSILDAGCAGGIVFELQDEWFKTTWSVAPFEVPAERRRLWFDAESPEESYGIVANRPAGRIRVDGDPSDWSGVPPLASAAGARAERSGWSSLRELSASSDEGYLYLLLRTRGGPEPPDWSRVGYRIAIDTYDPARGETRLPPPGPAEVPTGAEFLVDLAGPGRSFVTASAPYEPYAGAMAGAIASPASPSGEFVHLVFESNRERFGRDGTRYPAVTIDRGALRYGSLDPASPALDTRSDVSVGARAGAIEMRIPWGLLNVSDPSSHRVLHQPVHHVPPYDTAETDGFRIYAYSFDPSRPEAAAVGPLGGDSPPRVYRWPGWETPSWRSELKQGAGAIRDAMRSLPDVIPPRRAEKIGRAR